MNLLEIIFEMISADFLLVKGHKNRYSSAEKKNPWPTSTSLSRPQLMEIIFAEFSNGSQSISPTDWPVDLTAFSLPLIMANNRFRKCVVVRSGHEYAVAIFFPDLTVFLFLATSVTMKPGKAFFLFLGSNLFPKKTQVSICIYFRKSRIYRVSLNRWVGSW